ncbi:hypothetical protein GCM10009609_05030 [Pseudonocardia aurantiaca]
MPSERPAPQARRPHRHSEQGLGSCAVQWLFTSLLIVVSAGIAGYTGYLLRRLFTAPPGPPDVPAEQTP